MVISSVPPLARVDYASIMAASDGRAGDALVEWFRHELVYAAQDAYCSTTARRTDIVRITQASFEYVYDDYASLEKQGLVPYNPTMEARLVIAFGRSAPRRPKRDDARLRGWAGRRPLSEPYGPGWDRGHFIAYSMGGVVEGFELNIFIQRRALNRGWNSHDGARLYRKMEDYCASHTGTFCFSRPIYGDGTAKPTFLEFGILNPDGKLWVEIFDNQ